jgi:hypothetical protein
VDAEQALSEGEAGPGGDGAEGDGLEGVAPLFHEAIACGHRPWINA